MSNLLLAIEATIQRHGGNENYAKDIEAEWKGKNQPEHYTHIREFEETEILKLWTRGVSANTIAAVIGRNTTIVYRVINKFRQADAKHRKGNNR